MKSSRNKKKSPVKTAFATSLLVSLALFSAVFALNLDKISCFFGNNPCVAGSSSRNPAQGNWNTPGSVNNSAASQPFEDYIADTIFIGDSRTCGLESNRFMRSDNVYAIIGFNHQSARTRGFIDLDTESLLTIAEAIAIKKPERMIVSFGINGVAFMGQEKFMSEYDAFIDELKTASPDSILIIQSILPVSHSFELNDPRMANDIIDSYNLLLKNLAKDKGCRFLDTSGLLKNESNCLSSDFDSGDGLHFNKHAYEVLLQSLDQNRIY